jgi:hypothetical protein
MAIHPAHLLPLRHPNNCGGYIYLSLVPIFIPPKKSPPPSTYMAHSRTQDGREKHTAERERVKVVVDNDFCPWIDPSFCPASKDGPAAASLTTCIACVSFYIPLFYTALFHYTSLFFRSGEWCAVYLLPTFPFLLCAQSFLDFIFSLFLSFKLLVFFSFFIVPFPYFQSCNKSNIARCGAWDGRRSRPGPARPVPFPQRVSLCWCCWCWATSDYIYTICPLSRHIAISILVSLLRAQKKESSTNPNRNWI